MKSVIQIREAHFPSRAPISSYGNSRFTFSGMSHNGAILCVPTGIYRWSPGNDLWLNENFEAIFREAEKIEVLLVGTGKFRLPIPDLIQKKFSSLKISADSMNTGAAVRTYNVLLSEERAVAAALLAI